MKNIASLRVAMLVLLPAFLFSGCLKNTCRNTYKIYIPIYKTLSQARADMKSSAARPLEKTGKIYVYGKYIFLNEVGKGIHVIDNSDPVQPKNLSFIDIPNNVDLAVRGGFLYADSYSDVAVFDISDPTNVRTVTFMNNVIKDQNRYWYSNQSNPDSIRVVVGYNEKDTTVDCETYRTWYNCPNCLSVSGGGAFYAAPQTGVGGSMARFTIVNDYLYAVSNSELYSIDIAMPSTPRQTATKNLGWGIETIYPFQNKLFIGSRTGMFIYDLSDPANPAAQGRFTHATSCDPVIADGSYAYVTLRTGTTCAGTINRLDVVNISSLANPVLTQSYNLSNPHGLAKDGNKLLVCDGADGLKLYTTADGFNIQLVQKVGGLDAFDVIAQNGKAIVVAKDGLYQYDYSGATLNLLSKLPLSN